MSASEMMLFLFGFFIGFFSDTGKGDRRGDLFVLAVAHVFCREAKKAESIKEIKTNKKNVIKARSVSLFPVKQSM